MAEKCLDRPNIVFILSDDQGCWAMGCAGNPEIKTPNLDRLAGEGMRFENFFCTSPVCSPARASLLTGRIPSQHGVHDWIKKGNIGERPITYLDGQLAYTELLADAGYTCGFSGKWHLGNSIKPQKGFSRWYVHQKGGGPYYNAPMIRDGELITQPGYITDAITDEAIDFIEDHADNEPFYVSIHYTAPHSPWIENHPEEIVESYADCSFRSCPQEPPHPWNRIDQNQAREKLKGYFAAVTAMDLNIGRVLDRLDELNLREDTLICFLSDNGFNCGHHGIWGKGNGTFPINMYDTSVKVPAIMSHPGQIQQGVTSEALVSGYDFMPTLLDYLDLKNPEAENLPGTSFRSVLEGSGCGERENVVVYDEYGPARMIRSREWKYIHRYPYGPHELYDLKNDPAERANLIADPNRQKMVREMKARLESWFTEFSDPAFDGTREPVTGRGQLDLAGPAGQGREAFFQPEPENR